MASVWLRRVRFRLALKGIAVPAHLDGSCTPVKKQIGLSEDSRGLRQRDRTYREDPWLLVLLYTSLYLLLSHGLPHCIPQGQLHCISHGLLHWRRSILLLSHVRLVPSQVYLLPSQVHPLPSQVQPHPPQVGTEECLIVGQELQGTIRGNSC